jgi:hypothetical protein
MQTNKTIQVITLAGFLLLVSSFIAFKAGVFDRYFETEKPKVIPTNIDTVALNMAIQKIFPEPEPYDKNRPKVIGLRPIYKRSHYFFHSTKSSPAIDQRSILYQYEYEYAPPSYPQPKKRW